MAYNKEMADVENLDTLFLAECKNLHKRISCDFIGVALQKFHHPDVNWPYVCGNTNEKYKHVTVRYGKGIAGKVIATGSDMLISHFPENILGKSTDYPIMLAERLVSAYAVPIRVNGVPKGSLLIGYRKEHPIDGDQFYKVKEAVENMEEFLPSYFKN
ncbi:GAF domain-containing protein [Aquibacillus albus]|uniref:GAF domain-containing protein n=1 Tax=Aquibacillus albus TaxID=1168171 RepID=A0ABS2MYK6_9BACI|nr:GAF domain-containing protein [Aquibacillus albus]MBM7570955.1 hypothetical protein [Aquibacillus albus]